ncbi:hypothetical protein [Chryseobacterium vrystaatense]|uniref:C1q domain-containing protein n=1 Tax=Chryseobacterium vrystaatense TaxID=307480 RepID=A0A1M5BHE3_9FLAO|nr:hypothetical protein [Chryseobacterium vrystaatense]KFF26354.1 hypothetical protein IW16_10830 [Chryseobacterium vrystaatense]SHF42004.1 hypothetical protein SAMN02787073_2266 [Chryseobacterium vrystaatense]
MKTKIYSLLLALSAIPVFSQVGINTSAPSATLDVNGTMKVRDIPLSATLPGYEILALNNTTAQVSKVDPQLLLNSSVNSSVFAAKKATGISLLSVGIFGNFKPVNFLSAERTIGNAALFNDATSSYTVPSDGVYAISYSFRFGTGIQASLLSSGTGIGITKTTGAGAGTTTLIDTRTFSGINLVVASLTIADTNINALYSFQAGDRIAFGFLDPGINLGLLSTSLTSFYIYKVSN